MKPIAPLPALSLDVLRGSRVDPLAAPDVRTFLLARMAIRRAVARLGLAGKVVLAPDYHHGVEIDALLAAGAVVRFYRVDRWMQADLEDVERAARQGAAALYLIHYLGFPQPLAESVELCRRHGLALIEDCALAWLSHDGDRPLGTTGDAAVWCLYKSVPVPHGGLLRMREPGDEAPAPPNGVVLRHLAGALMRAGTRLPGGRALAGALRMARALANPAAGALGVPRVAVGSGRYDHALGEMAMARPFRRMLGAIDGALVVRRRRANYQRLMERLGAPAVGADLPQGVCPLFFPMWVRDKDGALERLWRAGIGAVDFWRRPHPAVPDPFAREAQWLRDHVVELPCHQDLDAADVGRVAAVAREARDA